MAQFTSSSQLGQANLAGADTALYLDMFSGEVMRTFKEKNIMMGLTRVQNVGAGRSWQFPVIGQASSAYHDRNVDILDPANNMLNLIEHGARTINVDKTLMSNVMVYNWDELLNHYETRGPYADELGLALANQMDRNLLQIGCLAAREPATLSATQAATKQGVQLPAANASTSADILVDQMKLAVTTFEERDVDPSGVVFIVRPSMYYEMVDSGRLLNTDFGNAGNGSEAMGKVLKGYGFRIITTNHLPSTVISPTVGERNVYSGDFTQTTALALHKDAIATVMRQGVVTEQDYRQEYQGTLLSSKVTVGHGILRPEGAIEIIDTNL